MSFWQKQDGSQIENITSFDAGGDIQPIPNNTALIAAIEEAKWAEYDGEHYINLKWRIMRPADYANRVLFQKLHVFDPKKGDKAKQMLAAIDANCGGKLSKLTETPEDMHLMTALVGKPMAVKVQIWDINGKTGNWISAVSPAKSQAPVQAQAPKPSAPRPPQRQAPVQVDDDLDSIPF